MIKHDTAKDVYVLLKYHKLTSEKLTTKQCGSLCHGLRVMHTFWKWITTISIKVKI